MELKTQLHILFSIQYGVSKPQHILKQRIPISSNNYKQKNSTKMQIV